VQIELSWSTFHLGPESLESMWVCWSTLCGFVCSGVLLGWIWFVGYSTSGTVLKVVEVILLHQMELHIMVVHALLRLESLEPWCWRTLCGFFVCSGVLLNRPFGGRTPLHHLEQNIPGWWRLSAPELFLWWSTLPLRSDFVILVFVGALCVD
jgi:hypothetical protein